MKTKPKIIPRLSDVVDQKYCTMDPPYPERAYVVAVLCFGKGKEKLLWPLDALFDNLDAVTDAVKAFQKEWATQEDPLMVPDVCFVLPVTFSRRYPLRPEFWQEPSNELSVGQRGAAFISLMGKPMLHSLLVTPIKREASWEFQAALPMLRTTSDASLEQLMLTSDLVVSPEAKNVAVYSFSTTMVYNWVERRRVKNINFQADDDNAN